jgi:hypothetical protein
MGWHWEKHGNLAQCMLAIVAVSTFFLTLVQTHPMMRWFVLAGVLIIVIVPAGILAKKIKKMPAFLIEIMKFTVKLLLTSVATGIVSLTIAILYRDYVPTALCEVVKCEGTKIAQKTENSIMERIREFNEKVILALVESEVVRNRVYGNALDQAKNNNYIDFIDARYQTRKNWIALLCALTKDKNGIGEKLLLTEDEKTFFGDGQQVTLLLAEVLQRLAEDERRQILKETPREKSILLTEDERKVIKDCFNKHNEKNDLYTLMHLVLSDATVIKELASKEAYDVEYYELGEYREACPIAADERIVRLSDSTVVIKRTVRHLSPYDKVGIIGCYISELRFQLTKSNNQLPKSSP